MPPDLSRQSILAFWQNQIGDADLTSAVNDVVMPLVQALVTRRQTVSPLVVGVSGAQGSGKTTLTTVLQFALEAGGYRVAAFSLDDLYLPLAARQRLRADEPDNPYYRIARGNPGTHDVALGAQTITALKAADEAARTPIPAFDKSSHAGQGERVDAARWPVFIGRPDFVLLEGWCVGAPSLPDTEYRRLKNAAPEVVAWEQRHDPAGQFGSAVNERLREYAPLFACLDALIYLKVPSLPQVYAWREKQEAALRARTGAGMSPAQIREFVDAFLPITAVHGLGVLGDPSRSPADFIVEVDDQQRPARLLAGRGLFDLR